MHVCDARNNNNILLNGCFFFFFISQMSGFLQDADDSHLHDMSSVIENFQKKNSVRSMGPSAAMAATTSMMTAGTTTGNHMVSRCSYHGHVLIALLSLPLPLPSLLLSLPTFKSLVCTWSCARPVRLNVLKRAHATFWWFTVREYPCSMFVCKCVCVSVCALLLF